MDESWQESDEADRTADALIHDANLLKDVRDLVRKGDERKPMKYSPEWWRDWRQTTRPCKVSLKNLGSETQKRQLRPALPFVSSAQKSVNMTKTSGRSNSTSATQRTEEHPTVLSVGDLLFISVENLIKQKDCESGLDGERFVSGRKVDAESVAKKGYSKPQITATDTVSSAKKNHDTAANVLSPSSRNPGASVFGVETATAPNKGPAESCNTTCKTKEPRASSQIPRAYGNDALKCSVVFGVEKRKLDNAVKRSPGPIYSPAFTVNKPSAASTKFGTEQRGEKPQRPSTDAQYTLPAAVGAGRAASLHSGPVRPWFAADKKDALLALVAAESRGAESGGLDAEEEEEEVYPFQAFGFGCSMEEHVLYGQCLDGRCCARSHMEQVVKLRVAKNRVEAKKIAKNSALVRRGNVAAAEPAETTAKSKKSALHFACAAGGLDTVHKLLLSGAPTDVADKDGNTPLALAAADGHVRVVQRLVVNAQYPQVSKIGFVARRLTPSINVTDNLGRTPLHRAAQAGHHTIVKLLLEAGANAEVQDHENRTALDVCSSPLAFHLLRSRAEVYNRRERLAGVALKKNLLESANEVATRETTRAQAAKARQSVVALEKATDVMEGRVSRVDADVFNYKAAGGLRYESRLLEEDAALGVDSLVDLCLRRERMPSRAIMTELGISP
mmetsp:Transcript_68180/g.137147  ORF Transcript_68180/g.137147 Transcript_68180/m.137147 type:complete len:673 (-) Transcript_68180:246-2264(-)